MTPLQTTYNGVKYRSRTEARWAVFFESMGVKFIYEPEGYNLDGVMYLVDFFVPDWNAYFEVKNSNRLSDDEIDKAKRLSAASGIWLVIVNGTPSAHEAALILRGGKLYQGEIMTCRRCENITVSNGLGGYQELSKEACQRIDCGDRQPTPNELFKQAIAASANERFGVHA